MSDESPKMTDGSVKTTYSPPKMSQAPVKMTNKSPKMTHSQVKMSDKSSILTGPASLGANDPKIYVERATGFEPATKSLGSR